MAVCRAATGRVINILSDSTDCKVRVKGLHGRTILSVQMLCYLIFVSTISVVHSALKVSYFM